MGIIERLNKIIEHEGLTVSGFAKKIGVADQSIRGIVVQRRNKPGFDIIEKIIHTFEWLNADWLITGRGEMVKTNKQEQCSGNKIPNTNEYINILSYLKEKDEKIEQLIEEKTELKLKIEQLKKNK